MVVKVINRVSVKEKVGLDGTPFYYIELGKSGGRNLRVWVSEKLVKHDDKEKYVEFPMKAMIHITSRGNFVLKPDEDSTIIHILVPTGFRGDASIYPPESEEAEYKLINYRTGVYDLGPKGKVVKYSVYRSPRGRLGIDEGALVEVRAPFWLNWSRTGRLYGEPGIGLLLVRPDGTIEEFPGVKDPSELEEIKKEVKA